MLLVNKNLIIIYQFFVAVAYIQNLTIKIISNALNGQINYIM